MKTFQAFWVQSLEDEKKVVSEICQTTLEQLSPGDTLIKIDYSSINYKDALATRYRTGVIQQYPMIPGIDLAGTVLSAPEDASFETGDKVLVTGYGTGVSHTGGFSEIARVPQEWVVALPKELSLKESMIYGTAGFTAALAIEQLEKHGMQPQQQPNIVITGASGGVGSLAIAMLHQLGYENITAISRKKSAATFLKNIGAQKVDTPEEWMPEKIRPLGKQSIHYVIDTVGGKLLSALLPRLHSRGAAALCGNAAGINLETTVLPFILRGIHLLGIDSVQVPQATRKALWEKMATLMKPSELNTFVTSEITLPEIPSVCKSLLEGQHQGRTIVNVNGKQEG